MSEIMNGFIQYGIGMKPRINLVFNKKDYDDTPNTYDIQIDNIDSFLIKTVAEQGEAICISYDIYNKILFQYLGNDLVTAIKNLGIKEVKSELPTISGHKFFAFGESPWEALCRIMLYIPSEYYWVCEPHEIRIFKAPINFPEIKLSTVKVTNTPYRYINDLVTISDNNYMYSCVNNIAISDLQKNYMGGSKEIISNFMNNQKRSGNIYKRSITFTDSSAYRPVGTGVNINGINYMILSVIFSIGHSDQSISYNYTAIEVQGGTT